MGAGPNSCHGANSVATAPALLRHVLRVRVELVATKHLVRHVELGAHPLIVEAPSVVGVQEVDLLRESHELVEVVGDLAHRRVGVRERVANDGDAVGGHIGYELLRLGILKCTLGFRKSNQVLLVFADAKEDLSRVRGACKSTLIYAFYRKNVSTKPHS